MCEPVSISTGLMIALSATTAAVGYAGQKKTARDNRHSLQEQAAMQQEEIRAAQLVEQGERTKAARAERARMAVAAGEAGVSGVSVEDALFDSFLQEDLDLGLLAKDGEFALRASQARLNAGLRSSQGPSALEVGLGLASAGYQGYSAGLQIKQQRNQLPQVE